MTIHDVSTMTKVWYVFYWGTIQWCYTRFEETPEGHVQLYEPNGRSWGEAAATRITTHRSRAVEIALSKLTVHLNALRQGSTATRHYRAVADAVASFFATDP